MEIEKEKEMTRTILPREVIRIINKSVITKWEKGELRDLVKLLIDSHEELRWEAERYKRFYEISQGKRKK